MILLDIKRYIKQHHEVTLNDIRHHFDLDEDAARALLEPLIRQGHIQVIPAESCASGHCSTDCNQTQQGDTYLWRDKCFKPVSIPIQVL
jgi:predicted ArsR family transcriptional regulator